MFLKVGKKIFVTFCFYSDLSDQDKLLFESTLEAREKAQAPHSHYKVGAAVAVYDKGATRIYSGYNVEHSTYTQTTYAEQNAIDTMIATHGTKKINKVCVVGAMDSKHISFYDGNKIEPIPWIEQARMPCGHGLQIIWENCFRDSNVELLSITEDGLVAITTISDALPMRFSPQDLGIKYK